jgi:exopolysaccharide production protein ExoY
VLEYVAKRSFRAGEHEGAEASVALGGNRKRALDIAIAGIALILLAPILLATAILIRLLIGRSVLAASEWVGLGGKAFTCYQFRCAVSNGNDTSSAIFCLNDHSWAEGLACALRGSGLDKLPLLFGVLLGDMSLIGPRPIKVGELLRYSGPMPEYFTARPGITGLWRQSAPPNRRSLANQIALDRYYIRSWSMRLDLALLIKAVSAVA